jgi:hypothetical protein
MKTLLLLLLIISSILVYAEFTGSIEDRSPEIDLNLTVLDASVVAEADSLALLGDVAVIDKSVKGKYLIAASTSSSLLVVRDPMTGKYGTSDGGIITRTREGESLSAIAADYGLDLKHEFSALPMGVLMPKNISAAASVLTTLRADSRILSADLDVNFYDARAN